MADIKEIIHPPKAVETIIESVPSDDELRELKYRQAQAQGQAHLRANWGTLGPVGSRQYHETVGPHTTVLPTDTIAIHIRRKKTE